MQLKLLNFHKVLSQFASNIIGAFIALIIYQSTQSFTYAFLFMAASVLLRVLITAIFYNAMAKKPQLFLAIRLIPFFLYSMSLLLLNTDHLILGIILSSIFYAFAVSFKDIPIEVIFSYSAVNKGASSNGRSRLFEYIGVISAIILGGLFLDNLPKVQVIILACGAYAISVIPLVLYYFKQRKTKGFNQEAVSNAVESYKDIKIKRHQQKIVSRNLLIRYFIIYLLFCAYDALMPTLSLYMFKMSAESYGYVSYMQAGFYAMFGLGCYIAGKLDERKDLTKIVSLNCILSACCVVAAPFAYNFVWLEVLLFAVIGFLYSFISIFCYSRMMMRCKIMGVGNQALHKRSDAGRYAQAIIYLIASISPVMFIPAFILCALMFGSCSFIIPINEEITRKMLVDYLQNNRLY